MENAAGVAPALSCFCLGSLCHHGTRLGLPARGGEARGQVSVILSTPAFPGSSPHCLPPPRLPTKCTTSWGGLLYSHSYGVQTFSSPHLQTQHGMSCFCFPSCFMNCPHKDLSGKSSEHDTMAFLASALEGAAWCLQKVRNRTLDEGGQGGGRSVETK